MSIKKQDGAVKLLGCTVDCSTTNQCEKYTLPLRRQKGKYFPLTQ